MSAINKHSANRNTLIVSREWRHSRDNDKNKTLIPKTQCHTIL